MKNLIYLALIVGIATGLACSHQPSFHDKRTPASDPADFYTFQSAPSFDKRSVHVIHLDGMRPDVLKTMLDRGQLPHFEFLLKRGRISFEASTVDKTETFKVIQAYLTSHHDTEVSGWWQFDRDKMQFINCDLHPIGVLNYLLGLEFPKVPTMYDFISSQNKTVAAGFTLHRRSIPFENYSRNYVEGIRGAFQHRYYDQVSATMGSFKDLLFQIANNPNKKMPTFSHSLIAAVDEFSHWKGIVTSPGDPDFAIRNDVACFNRKVGKERLGDIHEKLFSMLDDGPGNDARPIVSEFENKYFVRVLRNQANQTTQICLRVPTIQTYAFPSKTDSGMGSQTQEILTPEVAMATIMYDIQLGRLIQAMRMIQFDQNQNHFVNVKTPIGISQYLKGGVLENSYFEQTLFIIMGDHGFGDTKANMHAPDPTNFYRSKDSLSETFIEYLNREQGLKTIPDGTMFREQNAELGIDDTEQPHQLAFMHKDSSWQSPEIQSLVTEARVWGNNFLTDLLDAVKSEVLKKFWFFGGLQKLILGPLVDKKLDKTTAKYKEKVLDFLMYLYLHSEPNYVASEKVALQNYYDQYVKLIYGGSARSNAELFLPNRSETGQLSWGARPTFQEIVSYKATAGAQKTVLESLKANPGIGLIFIRKQNDQIKTSAKLPATLEILVMDRFGNQGQITVSSNSGKLSFRYDLPEGAKADPLGVKDYGKVGVWGSYRQWNEWGTKAGAYYPNVVGGMGLVLYSQNPAMGDISLMRAQGWNFGDNGGSHGGVHREEKLTVMLASGPGITAGPLFTKTSTYPNVMDMAPTALNWLGYQPTALADFARSGFKEHWDAWIKRQPKELLDNLDNIQGLNEALKKVGLNDFRISRFRSSISRMFKFMPPGAPDLPDYSNYQIDGIPLNLE